MVLKEGCTEEQNDKYPREKKRNDQDEKKVTVNADNGNAIASEETDIKNHEKQEKDGIIKPEIVNMVNMRLKGAVDIIDNVGMNTRR